MSEIAVICQDCDRVFEIESDMLYFYNHNEINPYICPDCGSYNCRNMTNLEIDRYNKSINIAIKQKTEKKKQKVNQKISGSEKRKKEMKTILLELKQKKQNEKN